MFAGYVGYTHRIMLETGRKPEALGMASPDKTYGFDSSVPEEYGANASFSEQPVEGENDAPVVVGPGMFK